MPSYIINDTGSSERMISNTSSVQGYFQYLKKHKHLMDDTNKKNQEFMRIRRKRKVLTFKKLIKQIGAGHFYSKLRYYLSSNLTFIRQLHQKYYK